MRCQKAMTVAKTAMRTTLIPVTVSSFEMLRRHIGPKVTTVTRMATSRGPIGVRGLGRGGAGGGNAERGRIYMGV